MSLYKRGNVWWFKFRFEGQVIRESANTTSKTLARDAERARRRELETAVNRIQKRERMPLFTVAAREWVSTKAALSFNSQRCYKLFSDSLVEEFGQRLVCDIGITDIAALQRKRLAQGKSGRTINYEIGTLRQILKTYGLWSAVSDRVKSLPERHDIGRATSREDEEKLIDAIGKVRSPALLPLFIVSIDSGLRASEVRSLRHKDLKLTWANGVISSGEIIVPKSKTEAGTGRLVPLTSRACGALTIWLSRFPEAQPESYVFPKHRLAFVGPNRDPILRDLDLSQPIGAWRRAWRVACEKAGVKYRWHDQRHTFVSRIAENPRVSEETIRALAGHVSKQMLQRYSHIRSEAKRAAIDALESSHLTLKSRSEPESRDDRAQNGAHVNTRDDKLLN
jgi:integrase